MATGGNNVDFDQILSITKELATVAAKQDQTLNAVNALQQTLSTNYVPRPEIEAKHDDHEKRIGTLEEAGHKNKATTWAAVSGIATAIMMIATIVTLVTHH